MLNLVWFGLKDLFTLHKLAEKVKLMTSQRVERGVYSHGRSVANGYLKYSKIAFCRYFLTDFTPNGQIWLFYAEKWISLKKRGSLPKVQYKIQWDREEKGHSHNCY